MLIKKPNFWNKINLLSLILLPFSFFYYLLFLIKKNFSTLQQFNIPIICIGNIFIGGTGKTPLSIYIYEFLKKKKFKPAIARKHYDSHFDEINLTKERVNHLYLNKKRIVSVENAVKKKNNVVILDDGFQDFSIKKDLNIICFNDSDFIGNGLLLPSGPLREPLHSLNKAHIVVINGKRNLTFEKKIRLFSEGVEIFYSEYKIRRKPKVKNKKILAFAGIGNPDSFFKLLEKNNFNIKKRISFPDHYSYKKEDIKKLQTLAKNENLKLITTEKDFFRLKQLGFKKIDYIIVDLIISEYKKFEKEILKYL